MEPQHYFSAQPLGGQQRREIGVQLAGTERTVVTAGGVFSADHLDEGTAVLLQHAPAPAPTGPLLDLGCGWGAIALHLALSAPDAEVWAVDVNERARQLTRENADRLNVANLTVVSPDTVPAGVRFAQIWSNPPIRVGKPALHALLTEWLNRLEPGGTAWLVVAKHLGADSLQRWLSETWPDRLSTRYASERGFRILRQELRVAR